MIKFAAQAGAIDEEKVILESPGAIKRAGADLIFNYFALDLAEKKSSANLHQTAIQPTSAPSTVFARRQEE